MSVLSRVGGVLLASSVALLLGVGVPSTVAAAATTDDVSGGFWYFDVLRFSDHHAAGWTGSGVTVAMIDSPINPEVPTLQNADIEVQKQDYCTDPSTGTFYSATSTSTEIAEHGTNVASFLVGTGAGYPGQVGVKGVAPEATVLYWAFGVDWKCAEWDSEYADYSYSRIVDDMIAQGVDILSVSQLIQMDPEVQAKLLRANIIVVGGVSNQDGPELGPSNAWPGGYNGSVRVQAVDIDGEIPENKFGPNIDPATNIVAPGVGLTIQGLNEDWKTQSLAAGTSFATPIVAGSLAVVKQKFPDATNNQILQSLVRNVSGNTDEEPHFDTGGFVGYGVISVTKMLETNPLSYPDVQPFIINTDPGFGSHLGTPTFDQIYNGESASNLPPIGSATPSGPEAGEPGSGLVLWLVGIGVGVLILIGLIVFVVVMAVRRSGRAKQSRGVGIDQEERRN